MRALPPGVFFDGRRESPRKYRVRVYKNGVAHLGGYFETRSEAIAALATLRLSLDRMPKKAGVVNPAWKPSTAFADVARASRSKQ